jgi:maltooligosyltrehalose trehalohydrolase
MKFHLVISIFPGDLYLFRLDNKEHPDPASYFQAQGVHGPSQVVDHQSFHWNDSEWRGIPLSDMIMYELHVGTFTPEGTFDAIIPRLDELRDLGVNAIEIMPVTQFPGERNWGYDGVYPFAVQNSYGGPGGLKRLINACHQKGISVILDVVYNHLGPEGNYLRDFGPYFTDRYKTPWGEAMNFDGSYSNEVRNFILLKMHITGWKFII